MRELLPLLSEHHQQVVKLLYFTGCRISELIEKSEWAIAAGDIKCLNIVDSKTANGVRMIPLHPSVEYLYGVNVRCFPQVLNQKLREVYIKEKITSHCFRNGFEQNMKGLGAPLEMRRALMGHSQQGTTDVSYGDWRQLIPEMKFYVDKIPVI